MSGKVWVVTEGEYSVYRIVGVFSTEDNARAFCAAHAQLSASDWPRVEEFDMDPEPPTAVTAIRVRMTRGGGGAAVGSPEQIDAADLGFQHYLTAFGDYQLVWNVQTDDPERAVKVVNEKRAMLIAADVWGDNDKTKGLLGRS